MFYFLAQVDFPTIYLLRSFEHPRLDQIGNVGNLLGNSFVLVIFSLTLGGIGYLKKSQALKVAGFNSLLAHGLVGLLTQVIKHSLGRPRPGHMDKGPWEIWPTFKGGYESFPSGHTSASFAFATVLAYYFPKWKFLWFGLAMFTGICRVTKGWHFPTDILGGLLLGILTGLAVVYAKNQWQEIGQQTLAQGLPWLVTAFGLVWILVPHPGMELEPTLSLSVGLFLMMMGFGLRLWWIRKYSTAHTSFYLNVPTWPRLLMGLGLASTTGSFVIVGASLLAGTVWWLETQSGSKAKTHNNFITGLNPILTEAALGIGMLLLTLLAFSVRSPSIFS